MIRGNWQECNNGVQTTDSNGEARFYVPGNGTYALVETGVPDGL